MSEVVNVYQVLGAANLVEELDDRFSVCSVYVAQRINSFAVC